MQKNIFKFVAVFFAVMCAFFFFKKITNPTITANYEVVEQAQEMTLPDDYHTFYDMFHSDSVYQMERIVFPLAGLTQSKDSAQIAESIQWTAQDWRIHKPFDSQNGTFERVFTITGGVITETITANGGLFSINKRYAKLNGEWYLIYYQDLLMNG